MHFVTKYLAQYSAFSHNLISSLTSRNNTRSILRPTEHRKPIVPIEQSYPLYRTTISPSTPNLLQAIELYIRVSSRRNIENLYTVIDTWYTFTVYRIYLPNVVRAQIYGRVKTSINTRSFLNTYLQTHRNIKFFQVRWPPNFHRLLQFNFRRTVHIPR